MVVGWLNLYYIEKKPKRFELSDQGPSHSADFILVFLVMKNQFGKTVVKIAPFFAFRWRFSPMTKQLKILYNLFAKLIDVFILSFRKGFCLSDYMGQAGLSQIDPFCLNAVVVTDEDTFPFLN